MATGFCANTKTGRVTTDGSRFRPSFLDTPYPTNKTTVDYIFVNQSQLDVLMKTKVMDFDPAGPEDLPIMEKAIAMDRPIHMVLKPKVLFPDPFRGGNGKIALCETYDGNAPSEINTRHEFLEFIDGEGIDIEDHLMGFEQEYVMFDKNRKAFGTNTIRGGLNSKINYGPSAGLEREVAEKHLKACMLAGLSLYGTVKENGVGQWEYQLGPTGCLRLADELIVSRYLLNRVAEMFDVTISFAPVHYEDAAKTKQITSGLHLNFSTKETRSEHGIGKINEYIRRLSAVDNNIILPYYDSSGGEDTKIRLSGEAPFDFQDFNTKRQYFRIPLSTQLNGRGYLEDRRPSADCDPYKAMLGFLKSIYTRDLL